ncbi:MAG: hypothetical protein ABSH38_22070 [Verrucomicrobiota bacterium]|jgi:predicted transcriptional regulator
MTDILTIRLDREEKRAVQRLAGKSGASQWVRGLIRAQLRSHPKAFLAAHKQWLAAHGEPADQRAILGWFRKNRR